jgi:hypothetical protein
LNKGEVEATDPLAAIPQHSAVDKCMDPHVVPVPHISILLASSRFIQVQPAIEVAWSKSAFTSRLAAEPLAAPTKFAATKAKTARVFKAYLP